MHQALMRKFQERIRSKQYLMTLHAEEEMADDAFTILDVEHAILSGQIAESQRDMKKREWKYLIRGSSLDDRSLAILARMSPTGKLVIITVYSV